MRLQCKQGPPSAQQTYRAPGCYRAVNLLVFVIVQQNLLTGLSCNEPTVQAPPYVCFLFRLSTKHTVTGFDTFCLNSLGAIWQSIRAVIVQQTYRPYRAANLPSLSCGEPTVPIVRRTYRPYRAANLPTLSCSKPTVPIVQQTYRPYRAANLPTLSCGEPTVRSLSGNSGPAHDRRNVMPG